VAGDAIARNAWPARIARDGTLHIATTDSIWAFELGHQGAEIAARLGVAKVRFAPGPLPSAEVVAAPVEPVRASREHEREASEIASSIGDEKLRTSVQKAIGLSLARTAKDRSF
jgi:Dna[CI] antecedent, DciA